jgi:large subunit ribosomal protein L23
MAKKLTTTEKEQAPVTSSVIIAPRITEKASLQSNVNAYTFVVAPNATKLSVAAEIKKTYKVTPTKVNITNIAPQTTFVRGKWGKDAGMKKAVVFLKKGDTIAISA